MRLFGSRRPRPVSFVYAPAFAGSGTSVMRGRQLAELAGDTALSERGVAFRPLGERFRGSDLFLTKGVLKTADDALLRRWKRGGNRLFLDPVDEGLTPGQVEAADVVVAASRSAFDAYRRAWPGADVRLLHHHVDPRVELAAASAEPVPGFRAGYFGELVNTVDTPAIRGHVDFVSVDTSREDDAWIARTPHYSVHYAIRQRRALDNHKPFLKGFTAAACRAVVLIQRSEEEPQRWLPPDYPYWLEGEATEANILNALEMIRSDVDSPRWREAHGVMQEMAALTSTRAIAGDLLALFSER